MEVGVDALTECFFSVQEDSATVVEELPSDIGPGTCITINGFVKPDCSR